MTGISSSGVGPNCFRTAEYLKLQTNMPLIKSHDDILNEVSQKSIKQDLHPNVC